MTTTTQNPLKVDPAVQEALNAAMEISHLLVNNIDSPLGHWWKQGDKVMTRATHALADMPMVEDDISSSVRLHLEKAIEALEETIHRNE